jgi:subtilisin family serine protease
VPPAVPPEPASLFESLHCLASPERLLYHPRADGRGVCVAVIDTGIDESALRAKAEARGQLWQPIEGGVFTGPSAPPLPYEGRQSAAHGTTVADIILTLAPGVRLYSADVFGPQGVAEVDTLIHALRWVLDHWPCHLINLSLGVAEQRLQPLPRRLELLRVIEDCYHRDVLVVAAAHNDHPSTRSYPALFTPPLLSVDKSTVLEALAVSYAPRARIEFLAHGLGYFGPFSATPATSWAAPHVTGVAARLLSLQPGLKPFEVKTLLYWLSKHRRAGG